MKLKKLLNFLRCPYCDQAGLNLKSKKRLVCKECLRSFSVVGGVPVLMKKNNLGEQEKHQLRWFENHYSQFSKEKYHLDNWRLSMLKRIFGNCPARVNSYLDLGCGATGYTVIEAAKRNDWLSFGIDISIEAMLRAKALAKKQGVAEKTGFVVCSAESLPFKKNLFNYISAISLLEHLENDLKVIRGVSRIIKKSGAFYICVPNSYQNIWPFLWPIYFYIDKNIGHKRHYSIEKLNKKMEGAGFKPKKVFYNGHLIKLWQLVLEKMNLIDDPGWWKIETRDVSLSSMGLQLNSIYEKEKV